MAEGIYVGAARDRKTTEKNVWRVSSTFYKENRDMDGDKVLTPGSKDHWIKIIERSTQDLHDRVNMQRSVLLTVLGKAREPPSHDLCPVADCPHRIRLRKVLLETIGELEETKKSFKSKRLEELRKRLMNVVKETD